MLTEDQYLCPQCHEYSYPGLTDARFDYGLIRDECWRPPGGFAFKGEGPVFYGMEIEVTDNGPGQLVALKHLGFNGELGWLKEDGSVHGFEINTHPMSYAWAMEHFPWGMLPDLEANGCEIQADTNGLHIHVSEQGFGSGSHIRRWVTFFHRCRQQIVALAGRDSYYGSWSPTAAPMYAAALRACLAQKELDRELRRAKPDSKRLDELRAALRGGNGATYPRYSAINLRTPYDTLEVRAFASTLSPRQAQAALGLVAGTVEYTRTVKPHRNWSLFVQWLEGQGDTYASLLAEIRERT